MGRLEDPLQKLRVVDGIIVADVSRLKHGCQFVIANLQSKATENRQKLVLVNDPISVSIPLQEGGHDIRVLHIRSSLQKIGLRFLNGVHGSLGDSLVI